MHSVSGLKLLFVASTGRKNYEDQLVLKQNNKIRGRKMGAGGGTRYSGPFFPYRAKRGREWGPLYRVPPPLPPFFSQEFYYSTEKPADLHSFLPVEATIDFLSQLPCFPDGEGRPPPPSYIVYSPSQRNTQRSVRTQYYPVNLVYYMCSARTGRSN